MIRIRPYKASDVDTILSWCQDEKTFYQWTAGILGNYIIYLNLFSLSIHKSANAGISRIYGLFFHFSIGRYHT